MPRADLFEAVMEGWGRLDPTQRQRFAEAFVKAALRLDRLELRAWLLRRVKYPPLSAPADPAVFALTEADMAALRKAMPLKADDANGGAIDRAH